MNYCREENYEAGTAEFKKAIELDGSEEKAYEQYIQAYIDATNKAEEAGTESTLNLDDALTLVSNRISSKHGGVEKTAQCFTSWHLLILRKSVLTVRQPNISA